jgi:exopolyphosphatase/guanosine-5'-triphosphate,3'-diphosphate pyrophosphatase
MGSVRFSERYIKSDPATDAEFWACQEAIDEALQPMIAWREKSSGAKLTAVAGTATTLAQWQLGLEKFDARAIDEAVLTRGDIHRLVEELKWRTVEERCKLPGIDRGRADVLLAGGLILWRSLEVLKFESCRVSTRGLRYGVLRLLSTEPARA